MKKLRIGLIGCGMIGRQHAEAIGRIPGITLAAVTEPDGDLLDKMRHYFGVPGYADYREMIERERPDVIHNCTPNNMHYQINRYALERGIHVYSEKPLAVTVEQGEELAALAKAQGLANGVNFNYRNNAMVQEMRVRMASGDAGRCFLVHGHYLQDWLQHRDDYNWRVDSCEGGASRAIADIGSHWFDTVQTVAGQKITAVYASNFVVHPERRKGGSDVRVETEDGGIIMFEMEDGTRGSLVVSQVSAGYKNQLYISADCEKYSMRWNQEQSDRLLIGTREHGVTEYFAAADAVDASIARYATLPPGHPAGWADAFANGFREFYNALAAGDWSEPSYADFAGATYIMKLVDACLKSSAEKRWVTLSE